MWILLGTFWPILGITLIGLIAIFFRKARWWVLFTGPVFVLFSSFAFADQIAANGNLLFMTLLVGLFSGLWIYYPILSIVGMVIFYRRSNQLERHKAED